MLTKGSNSEASTPPALSTTSGDGSHGRIDAAWTVTDYLAIYACGHLSLQREQCVVSYYIRDTSRPGPTPRRAGRGPDSDPETLECHRTGRGIPRSFGSSCKICCGDTISARIRGVATRFHLPYVRAS